MFELVRNGNKRHFNISINGTTYLYSRAFQDSTSSHIEEYFSEDKCVSKELIKSQLKDFGSFYHISLGDLLDAINFRHSISISVNAKYETVEFATNKSEEFEEISLDFYFNPDLSVWKENFSFYEFYKEFENLFRQSKSLSGILRYYTEDSIAFDFSLKIERFSNSIEEYISPYLKEVEGICSKVLYELSHRIRENVIFQTFNFPEELKMPCEQYLLYFAQFLRDLGINATSSLKEEAGKVLFSVTPTDDIEALDKIREALAVYLNLPASPIVYDESFAAMRLQQQVENLQHSQKMAVREIRSAEREMRLAQTVIEHQDKIIVQKDSIIEQQNKVIEKIQSKSIMMDSLENKAEFEKVFDGLEFGESKELKEKLGIKFNPVTSLKTLGKKLIGKDDEFTSLNLDKEDAE